MLVLKGNRSTWWNWTFRRQNRLLDYLALRPLEPRIRCLLEILCWFRPLLFLFLASMQISRWLRFPKWLSSAVAALDYSRLTLLDWLGWESIDRALQRDLHLVTLDSQLNCAFAIWPQHVSWICHLSLILGYVSCNIIWKFSGCWRSRIFFLLSFLLSIVNALRVVTRHFRCLR